MSEYFLSTAEAARYIGCDERTIRNYLASGRLLGERDAVGSWRVSADSLLRVFPEAHSAWYNDTLPYIPTVEIDNRDIEAYNQSKQSKPASVQNYADKWRKILNASSGYVGTNSLGDWCDWWNSQHPEFKTSAKSIYRMRKLVEQFGLLALLSDRKETRITTVKEQFYKDFKDVYMRQQRQSIPFCRSYALGCAVKRGEATQDGFLLDEGEILEEKFPSEMAFRRRLEADFGRRFEKRSGVVLLARYGKFKMNNVAGSYINRSYNDDDDGVEVGSVWVGDSRVIDVSITHPDGYTTRPYLTLFIDMRTKMPMGWHLHLDGPSTNNTLRALRNGVERFGVPKMLYLDNGKEYKNRTVTGYSYSKICDAKIMTSFTDLLHIEITFAIVKNAQAKIIERLFLEMKNKFDKSFLAFTGGNTVEKPEQLKDVIKRNLQDAFAKFRVIYEKQVGVIMPNTEMGGKILKGRSPVSLWNELIVLRNQTNPMQKVSIETSSKLTSRYEFGRVGRNGFHIKNGNFEADYWNDVMSTYKNKSGYLRYDPDDVRLAWFYDEQKVFICECEMIEQVPAMAAKDDVYAQEQIANGIARRRRDLNAIKRAAKVDKLTAEDIMDSYSRTLPSEQAIGVGDNNTLLTRHDIDEQSLANDKRKGKSSLFMETKIEEEQAKKLDLFSTYDLLEGLG